MALKREVAKIEDVAEPLRALYVEKDGKFVLDIDGTDDSAGLKDALEKERRSRTTTEKALRDLKAKLGDLDPDKAREALKLIADLEDKALVGDLPQGLMAKVEELLTKRTERMTADHKKATDTLTEQLKAATGRLEELLIDNGIRAAAIKGKVRATAVDDAVLLGKTVFRLKDGNPVPMKGEEVIFGKDGKTPLSPEEWIAERASDRAHWFEASGGTGGTTTTGGGPAGAVQITREKAKDPMAYRRAKAEAEKAGVPLEVVA